jgi:hypothetical protein
MLDVSVQSVKNAEPEFVREYVRNRQRREPNKATPKPPISVFEVRETCNGFPNFFFTSERWTLTRKRRTLTRKRWNSQKIILTRANCSYVFANSVE